VSGRQKGPTGFHTVSTFPAVNANGVDEMAQSGAFG
jgi:hypothetical protein